MKNMTRTAINPPGMFESVSRRRFSQGVIVQGPARTVYLSGPTPPATTWIGVTSLAQKEYLVEIEAIAVLKD